MGLAAGRLRDRITIRREVDVSDGAGGYDRSWTTIADRIAAEVISQGGREAMLGAAFQGISSYRIVIRKRDDLLPSDQILWNGQELNIRSATRDPFYPREATAIFADTGSPQGAAS